MNKKWLEAEMKRYGDTGSTLAEALGISEATLSRKKNGESDFTRGEMAVIKNRYNLTADSIHPDRKEILPAPGRRLPAGNDCRPAKRTGGEAGGHDPRFPGRGHLGDGTVR